MSSDEDDDILTHNESDQPVPPAQEVEEEGKTKIKYKCTSCDVKSYAANPKYKEHYFNKHLKFDFVKCKPCKMKFNLTYSFDRHIKQSVSHHDACYRIENDKKIELPYMFVCIVCEIAVKTEDKARHHLCCHLKKLREFSLNIFHEDSILKLLSQANEKQPDLPDYVGADNCDTYVENWHKAHLNLLPYKPTAVASESAKELKDLVASDSDESDGPDAERRASKAKLLNEPNLRLTLQVQKTTKELSDLRIKHAKVLAERDLAQTEAASAKKELAKMKAALARLKRTLVSSSSSSSTDSRTDGSTNDSSSSNGRVVAAPVLSKTATKGGDGGGGGGKSGAKGCVGPTLKEPAAAKPANNSSGDSKITLPSVGGKCLMPSVGGKALLPSAHEDDEEDDDEKNDDEEEEKDEEKNDDEEEEDDEEDAVPPASTSVGGKVILPPSLQQQQQIKPLKISLRNLTVQDSGAAKAPPKVRPLSATSIADGAPYKRKKHHAKA